VWEAAFDDEIIGVTKAAMWEAGMALIDEYPLEFNENTIGEHIDDLIRRFGNKALGDSIYRAGRDLYRKLDPNDRLLGAINLCVKHGRLQKNICFGVAAALYFKAVDDSGKMFDRDRAFHEMEMSRGLHHVLSNICKIHAKGVYSIIEKYYSLIERGEKNVHAVLGSV
jgi:mannitol-1-phosphate 5-dehydrogenase